MKKSILLISTEEPTSDYFDTVLWNEGIGGYGPLVSLQEYNDIIFYCPNSIKIKEKYFNSIFKEFFDHGRLTSFYNKPKNIYIIGANIFETFKQLGIYLPFDYHHTDGINFKFNKNLKKIGVSTQNINHIHNLKLNHYINEVSSVDSFSKETCHKMVSNKYGGSINWAEGDLGTHVQLTPIPLITTNSGNLISFMLKINEIEPPNKYLGNIIFLPNMNSYCLGSFSLDKTLSTLKPALGIIESRPSWVNSPEYYTKTGQKLLEDLKKNHDDIKNLTSKNKEIKLSLQEEESNQELLYSDQYNFENLIISNFKNLNFNMLPLSNEDKEDFVIKQNKTLFIGEVKTSSKKSLNIQGIRQLLHWEVDYMTDSSYDNYNKKLIYIYNYDIKTPPSERNVALSDQSLQLVYQKQICLISADIFFKEILKIKNNKLKPISFLNKIKKTTGFFK